jgi:hypothetical protein
MAVAGQAMGAGSLLGLLVEPSVRAGTFDIPAGAQFNLEKLAKVGEFFDNEVATGKIPGAIVLIRQHARGLSQIFRRAGRHIESADHGPNDLSFVLDD